MQRSRNTDGLLGKPRQRMLASIITVAAAAFTVPTYAAPDESSRNHAAVRGSLSRS
jgi:hypothetical protein